MAKADRDQQPRRIILANRPRLLRGLLKRVIQNDPSIQIVGEVVDLARLPVLVTQTGAQLVILPLPFNGGLPEVTEQLSVASPSICILALATDGSRIKLKWIQLPVKEIRNLSLADLLGVLRRPASAWQMGE